MPATFLLLGGGRFEDANTLIATWSERLGLRLTNASVAYVAHRIRVLEETSIGRLATHVEDGVLRTLVAAAVKKESPEILEIGTLFGIGLAMLYDYNRAQFDGLHVTALDPLEGYYGKKIPDIVLGIPITQATFWRNMILGSSASGGRQDRARGAGQL